MKNNPSKIIYTLSTIAHSIVMILAYTSPFWLDWKLIGIFIILYYLQIWIFGGCVLTFAQYGTYKESFTANVITGLFDKIGVSLNKQKVVSFLNYLPGIFLVLAIIYQLIFNLPILIQLF